jgi:CubicO group peptidase (beta-lactamase class C family)
MLPYRGTSAGGGYSTVGDFLKFVNALDSHKLLDAEHTELLTTGKVATPRPDIKYAFGFEDQRIPDGVRFFGHGGGSPGMNGRLSIFPTSHYVVVVLANLDPPAADSMARFIGDRLPAQ